MKITFNVTGSINCEGDEPPSQYRALIGPIRERKIMATAEDNVFVIQDDQEFDLVIEGINRAGNPVPMEVTNAIVNSSMSDILAVTPQADGRTFTCSSTGKLSDVDAPVQISVTVPSDPANPTAGTFATTLLVKVVADVAAGIRLVPSNVRERVIA
jgi:hypothetical protein